MKDILLTGGTGFLGSKIVRTFLDNGYRVILIKRKDSFLGRLDEVWDNPNLVKLTLGKDSLEECFEKYNICSIIHTATCYGRNNESWSEILDANFLLPLRLLILGDLNGVNSFINSDTFFNEKISFEKREDLYVKTKKDFLELAKNTSKYSKINFINMRIEQMYGPSDNDKKFIPMIVKQLIENKPNILLTEGEQKRDFIYVDDVANSFLEAFKNQSKLSHYDELFIGTGKSNSIKEIVSYLKDITSSDSILEFGALSYRKNEIMNSCANVSNNEKINWKSTINWMDGLKKTVDFYNNK